MAVHFVYRSHYDNPGCFYVKRFDADNVLAWFQSIWKPIPDEAPHTAAHKHAKQLIGRTVYSFGSLFRCIHEHGWPVPKSMKELIGRLNESLYVGELKHGTNHVQILTDDDELEMAISIFDDHYAAKHPDRVAFLLRDDWRLPDGMAAGAFKPPPGVPKVHPKAVAGEGRTYFASFTYEDSSNLTDLDTGAMTGVIPGVRVPDLPRVLLALADSDDVHFTLRELLSGIEPVIQKVNGTEVPLLKAVQANPNDTACWAAYSDWCEENGQPTLLERILASFRTTQEGQIKADVERTQDHIHVQGHVAQACKHVAQWGPENLYHCFVLFDDLWANAHPHLASSLLRAGNLWDIL